VAPKRYRHTNQGQFGGWKDVVFSSRHSLIHPCMRVYMAHVVHNRAIVDTIRVHHNRQHLLYGSLCKNVCLRVYTHTIQVEPGKSDNKEWSSTSTSGSGRKLLGRNVIAVSGQVVKHIMLGKALPIGRMYTATYALICCNKPYSIQI